MGQISMKIMRLTGSVLDENQQTGRSAVPVERGGVQIGHVTLDAIRGRAEFQP